MGTECPAHSNRCGMSHLGWLSNDHAQQVSVTLAVVCSLALHTSTYMIAPCDMQSRTDCGPENMSAEEREAISVRLTRLLTAYAFSDPVVGYCQGKPCFFAFACLLPGLFWTLCMLWKVCEGHHKLMPVSACSTHKSAL